MAKTCIPVKGILKFTQLHYIYTVRVKTRSKPVLKRDTENEKRAQDLYMFLNGF